MAVTIKRGDTRRSIIGDITDPNHAVVDLTGADVRFLMMKGQNVLLDHVPAYIEDLTTGTVAYHFEDGDTDTVGILKGWFKVTYPDGSRETFPDSGSIIINIE